jgi:sortase A
MEVRIGTKGGVVKKQYIVSAQVVRSIILALSLTIIFTTAALAGEPGDSSLHLPASLPDRPATRIVIPAIDVDAPVVVVPVRGGTWDMEQVTREVAHLQGTASPGDGNNVVLGGHFALPDGSRGPFEKLGNLQRGDQVQVYDSDGTVYVYTVDSMKVVEVTDIEVVSPTLDPILTLITCHNWNPDGGNYKDRLVVVAHLGG